MALLTKVQDLILTSLKLIILAGLLVLAIIGPVTNFKVEAQSGRGLIISPTVNDIEADAGKTYQYFINLENDTPDYTYNAVVSLESFRPSDNEGVPELVAFEKNNDYSNWLSFEKDQLIVNPRQKAELGITIQVPQNAKAGGYYFAIVLSDFGSESQTSGVRINQRIVSLLFVNVSGPVDRRINFESFVTNQQLYDPLFDPIDLKYKIKAEGGSYIKPSGNVYLDNGNKSGQNLFPLNPEEKIILPGSGRTLQISSPAWLNWPLFTTQVNAQDNQFPKTPKSIFPDWQRPWLGSQNIEGRVIFVDSNGQIAEQSTSTRIYFFPWKGLLIGLGIFVMTALLYLITLRFQKKQN